MGLPVPRHEAGFVALGGEFYLLGGRGIRPISIYDPEEKTWKKGSKPPLEFHHFQAVAYREQILIVTAMTGAFPHEKPLDRVLHYDPRSDTWEWGHQIPEARRRGAAGVVRVGDLIYVTGGLVRGHMGGFVHWHDAYNPDTGQWHVLPDAPHARDHFQSASLRGKLYAAGGRMTSKETASSFRAWSPQWTFTILPALSGVPSQAHCPHPGLEIVF